MTSHRCRCAVMMLGAFALLGACNKAKLIPNTQVADTPVNRDILRTVEKYRRAVERRNAAEILALVHPSYQDAAGTPDASDDIDYEGLKQILTHQLKHTSKIRLRIEYQHVAIKGREAEVDTYVDGTFVYDIPNANPRWRRLTDYNRFRLLRDGKRWQFISGL